jgi:hypothetical protein
MPAKSDARPFAVSALIFLQIFLGLQGLFGGGAFLLSPDGSLLQMPFTHLKKSPFADFTIPGLLLFLFLGIYPIADAYGLWKRPAWHWPDVLNPFKGIHWSWAGSLAAGVIAIIWIVVQVQWVPVGFLHYFILAWGALILMVTLLPVVRQYYTRKRR